MNANEPWDLLEEAMGTLNPATSLYKDIKRVLESRAAHATSERDCPKCGGVKTMARHNADWTCHKCGHSYVEDEERAAHASEQEWQGKSAKEWFDLHEVIRNDFARVTDELNVKLRDSHASDPLLQKCLNYLTDMKVDGVNQPQLEALITELRAAHAREPLDVDDLPIGISPKESAAHNHETD